MCSILRCFLSIAVSATLVGSWLTVPSRAAAQDGPECTLTFSGFSPSEVALSPCEKYVAVAGYRVEAGNISVVIAWDIKSRKEVFRQEADRGSFLTLSFSPDGKYLAAGGGRARKTVKVWEFPSGKEVTRLKDNDLSVYSLRFAKDRKILGAVGLNANEDDYVVCLWETDTFQKESTIPTGLISMLWKMAISRDAKWVAAIDVSGAVHLWTIPDGKRATLAVSKDQLRDVCFSTDGKMLAYGGMGGVLGIVDPSRFEEPIKLKGQDFGVFSVVFSPDRKWLFSGGGEFVPGETFVDDHGSVEVWNITERKLHTKFKAHTLPVLSMVLSCDAKTLVTCSKDNTVKVWSLPKEFHAAVSN